MAIEAPLSKYQRNNFLIYIAGCLLLGLWFGYDGYINKTFISEHTTEQGEPNSTLVFNRKAPPVLFAGAMFFSGCLYAIRSRRVVAAEDALLLPRGRKIPYDDIEMIDRTHFEKKGFFTIAYRKRGSGALVRRKLNDRQYDNLEAILDHLVAQISPPSEDTGDRPPETA